MPRHYVFESFEEYSERHGGAFLKDSQGRFIFPDGAVARQSYRGDWALYEPSDDEESRLEIQRLYWATRVTRAERDFRILKTSLTGGQIAGQCTPGQYRWDEGEFGPSPSADGATALKHLQNIVMERRAELKKVEDEIFNLPQNVAKRETEKQIAEKRQQRQIQSSETIYEIEKISI